MTQATKDKGFIQETIEYVKNNKNLMLMIGVSLAGVAVGVKYMSQRVHPDIRKVLQLRQTIQKSYQNALQSLETLNIEKRILTQFGQQGQNSKDSQQELDMLYLVISRLKLKESNKQKELRNPFLPPFEDGLFITELQPTHRLLYNKYNIFKNHLLVVTKQFQAQSNLLNETDFRQSILVLKALNGLLFYNSGSEAGSSQPHKHIQIFPNDSHQLPIVQSILSFVKVHSKKYNFQTQPIIQFPGFNFVHGLVILKPDASLSVSKRQMHRAYRRILDQKILRIKAAAYNIIATEEFILVVARSKQKAFDEISINAVGFMGSMLFKDEQKLNKYLSLKIKPINILRDITYPKNYSPPKDQNQDSESIRSIRSAPKHQ